MNKYNKLMATVVAAAAIAVFSAPGARGAAPVAAPDGARSLPLRPCQSVSTDAPLTVPLGKSRVVGLPFPVVRIVVGGRGSGRVGTPRGAASAAQPGAGTQADAPDGVAETDITLIGLYQNGRARMGVIDQPFTGERWFADGARSHYRGPGGDKVLRTSACETIANAILFTTSPHLFQNEDDRRYREIERKAKLFRYGCDCYAYALLASGHVDLVVENSLKPYDVGAIIPVVEQAGGVMTTWDGGRPEMGGYIIAAANAKLHA